MEHAKADLSALNTRESNLIFQDFRFTSCLKDKYWKSIPITRYDMPSSSSTTRPRLQADRLYQLQKLSYAKISRSISHRESSRKKNNTEARSSLHPTDFKSLTQHEVKTFSALCIGEGNHHPNPVHSHRNTFYRKKFASLDTSEIHKESTQELVIYPSTPKKTQRRISSLEMQLETPKSLNKLSSDRLQNTAHDLLKRIHCLNDTYTHVQDNKCEIGVNTDEITLDEHCLMREDTYSSQLSQTFHGELKAVQDNSEVFLEFKIPEVHITYSSKSNSPKICKVSMRNTCSIDSRINSKDSTRRRVFLKHKDQVIIDESLSHQKLNIQGNRPDREARKDSREFVSMIPVRYISKFSDDKTSHTERKMKSKDLNKLEPLNYRYTVQYNTFNQLRKAKMKKLPLRRLLP